MRCGSRRVPKGPDDSLRLLPKETSASRLRELSFLSSPLSSFQLSTNQLLLAPHRFRTRRRRKGSFSVLPTQPLRKLTAHKSDTNCLSISPDSRLLATGSDDRSVIIWDAATGAQKSVLQGSGAGVMAVGFSYANDMVIAGANDNAAKVWTLSTGRLKVG